MRVLHTVHVYPPDVGGSEAVVHRLSTGLADRGHEVEVATSAHPDRESSVDGIPVHEFPGGPLGAMRYRRFVHRGVDEDRWDVVMTYHSKVFTHLSLAPFSKVQDRWVYCPTEFTDLASPALRHRLYYGMLEARSLRRARRSVLLTERDVDRALDVAGEEVEDRLRVVPNGVDHAWWAKGEAGDVRERLDLPDQGRLVVYVGGLWEHKDVETLVGGISRLRGVHLALVGDARGRREDVERRARAVGAPNRVHVLGHVDREDLRALFHAADAFASASRNEGFGLVFLEAMACGLPVVARPVGVVPELVDEGADVLVAYNVEGFARALETAIGQDAPANRRIAERYRWENVVDRWEAVYREVVA